MLISYNYYQKQNIPWKIYLYVGSGSEKKEKKEKKRHSHEDCQCFTMELWKDIAIATNVMELKKL